MAIAQFLRTEILDKTDQSKSIAIVLINEEEVRVPFWYSIIGQYSKEDVRALICAEGLIQAGFVQDAIDLISPGADGFLTKDEHGGYIDTRNWRQNWLDAHPAPPEIITPDNDPLL